MIQEDIKAKIKEAMMARDTVRLEVYRGMSAAFTNELVAKGRKPQEVLSEWFSRLMTGTAFVLNVLSGEVLKSPAAFLLFT